MYAEVGGGGFYPITNSTLRSPHQPPTSAYIQLFYPEGVSKCHMFGTRAGFRKNLIVNLIVRVDHRFRPVQNGTTVPAS